MYQLSFVIALGEALMTPTQDFRWSHRLQFVAMTSFLSRHIYRVWLALAPLQRIYGNMRTYQRSRNIPTHICLVDHNCHEIGVSQCIFLRERTFSSVPSQFESVTAYYYWRLSPLDDLVDIKIWKKNVKTMLQHGMWICNGLL